LRIQETGQERVANLARKEAADEEDDDYTKRKNHTK
jgi:hypothetical protein